MTKLSSSLQGGILIMTLLLCLSLLRVCHGIPSFSDIDLGTMTTGLTISGNALSDYFGVSVSTAGDIDNDGYDDLIVGAYYKNNYQGAAYVIYGGYSLADIDLSSQSLNPLTTGFTVSGSTVGDKLGYSVSTAGDVDGDEHDDIIIGAYAASGKGAAYVIYGGDRPSMSNWDFSSGATLNPSTTGFTIIGNANTDEFGVSVSTAGDIDNDGFSDIIIGAHRKVSYRGAAYVIYGKERSSMTHITLALETLAPQSTGFMITGNLANDRFGRSVSTAGDINKDGYGDIIIGAYGKDTSKGAAYVIYGGDKASMAPISLISQTLNPATTGFTMKGNTGSENFGISVKTAGDIDKDGYSDIIIGAPGNSGNKGAAYVIYGGPTASMSDWDFSSGDTLDPSTTGFMIKGNAANDYFGFSVSTVRDINSDGFHDIIIGAHQKSSSKGAAYVIYGGQKSSRLNIDLSTETLDPATTGFMITGSAANDELGVSVSAAADINKDGYPDIIVAADGKNGAHGAAYIIYGGIEF